MELLVCGSAAAEGIPAMFCHCPVCREARARGGRDLRSRAAYMIGEKIRIDFGPDTYLQAQHYALPLERLEHLLVTHSHPDHWAADDLRWREPGFSVVPETAILHIYGNEKVGDSIAGLTRNDPAKLRLAFHLAEAFQPSALDDGITATPFPAAHDADELCVNYLLDVQGCRVLQGNDTGWWAEPVWEFLAGKKIDVVLLDSTCGIHDVKGGHLSGRWVVQAKQRLAESGALAPGSRFIATHFSHNGAWLHKDAEAFYRPHGIEVAYDGLRVPLAAAGANG